MYVNLDLNSLVLLLRDRAELVNLLPGWLTAEKPYYEQQTPYAYLESISLPANPNSVNARHIITLTVVMGSDGTDREFKEIITVFDNLVMSTVDWCLPIKQVWEVRILGVSKWQSHQKFRYSEKWNLNLSQDYYFDVVTVK
jgi:hypothetical protein